MSVHTARTPIVVTHEGGMRFAAQIRSHRVVVDQPLNANGGDTGPAPIELLGASLGTCVAFYVQQFCQARGLSAAGLRVEVEQHGAASPARIDRFVVSVSLPERISAKYMSMLEQVVRSCPVHNTLTLGAELRVVIAEPAEELSQSAS